MQQVFFGPIKQWGFLVRDIDASMKSWVEQLGVGPWWCYRNVAMKAAFQGAEHDVVIDVAMAYQNGVQIELIQQRNDAPSPYRTVYDRPQAQMPHHIAFLVPDVDASLAQAKAAGFREHAVMHAGGARYIYLESPGTSVLIVELIHADPSFVADYEHCAAEAAVWDGSNPYRTIS